jgi:hypothetical protein
MLCFEEIIKVKDGEAPEGGNEMRKIKEPSTAIKTHHEFISNSLSIIAVFLLKATQKKWKIYANLYCDTGNALFK